MKVTVDISNDCPSHWTPDARLCRQWIEAAFAAAAFAHDSSVSLSFLDEAPAAELNSKYRGKPDATNVLSFPSEFPEQFSHAIAHKPLGDIVICPAVVEREASAQHKELQAHWAHLLIHGLFHLLGHDHEQADAAREMEQLEVNALRSLGISDPYLIGC